jgi:hypothetical protein
VYVYFKSRYIDVTLRVPEEVLNLEATGGSLRTEVQLLVDLYDDCRLADISSLETPSPESDDNTPRYAAPSVRNPGLCLNCERVQWELNVQLQVKCQWLEQFEDELDEATQDFVFASGMNIPYNIHHPWVEAKLRDASEFRPAVLIYL